jgi:hypothetical protein
MFNKIKRSWVLFQTSLTVMNQNRKLLAFPALIGVSTLCIALFFISPIILMPTGHGILENAHWQALGHKLFTSQPDTDTGKSSKMTLRGWVVGYGMIIYLASMFIATFCNVALFSEVIAALNGRPVSFRHGFGIALSKIKSIAVWSLFAGLIGIVIQQIEQRLSFLGRVVAGFIGLSWSVASVFYVPVLIREESTTNPIRILAKSASTIKRTWGEVLTGYVGLQGVNAVVAVLSILIIPTAVVLAAVYGSFLLLIPVGVIWLGFVLTYSYLATIVGHIYLCALYIYASEGVVPEPFNRELLDGAWRAQPSKV